MSEQKARIYTILIRVAIIVVFSAFLILFVFQYANMIKLQSKSDALNAELAQSTQQNKDMQDQINQIQNPDNEDQPTDEYIIDTAHENGYVEDGETYINGDGNGN